MLAELKTPTMANDPPTVTDPADASGGVASSVPGVDLAALWQRVLRNDQRAFESVYRACSGAVYGLCLRMTANTAVADDATQATFVQAWVKRESFRGDAALKTWLHRIAVNEVLGRGRSEGRFREVIDEYGQLEASDAVVNHSPDMDLERAIAALPERSRQVFVLHAIHGYKHDEVGEMMGIAAGTSKAHFHRSREILQKSLGSAETGGRAHV